MKGPTKKENKEKEFIEMHDNVAIVRGREVGGGGRE